MKLALLFFCAAYLYITPGKAQGPFCYEEAKDCGPKSWGDTCNKGRNQSPINFNINSDFISKAGKAKLYYSRDYCQDQDFILKNNGHTVQASVRGDLTSTSFFQGDQDNLANKQYVFSQLHFHWGSNKDQGSEHTFNDKSYVMEAHLVHYSSEFDSLTDAIKSKQPNALAVVGIVYVLSDRENMGLKPILKALKNLKKSGDSTTGTNLNLVKLLPKEEERFHNLQYNGSLTTPDCAEVVLWNVLRNADFITETQLQQFRDQSDARSKPLQDNFRPTQDLNDREVRVYKAQVIHTK